uniref:Regulator of nonsense transcripts 3B-like n=1 Tax=Phallusia mammillata TaxID=59560 RepID=A0A6F9DWX3_9ASCI|nr:regulator of nonsense transcripts 3B-like [Phallusia mammillata]
MSNTKEEAEDVKDEKKKKKEKNLISSKVIVRRLPPGFTQEEFLKVADPVPDHDYFRFVPGDRTLAPNNFCRVYINFTNVEEIVKFRDKLDGLEIDKNGHRTQCIVEFSPFQKVPKKLKKKEDPKANTIEQDPEYVKFVESLEEDDEKNILDVEKYLDELEKRDKQYSNAVDTPLTTYIKQKREERKKLREERKRLDIERRKKKDEERRRRRELEKKKRIEAEKARKKKEVNGTDDPKKKTLAETMREANARPKSSHDDDGKMKILQKDGVDAKKQTLLKATTNNESASKPDNHKEARKSQTLKESAPPPRWRNEDGKNEKYLESGKRDDKHGKGSTNKKPDRQIYRPSSPRGRGSSHRPGSGRGGTRPQKYSEQRNRSARKSEADQ